MRLSRVRRTYVLATLATLLSVCAVGCGGSGWGSVIPHYTPETAPYQTTWTASDAPLIAVKAFGGNSIYAVGNSGTILHSVDGVHWVRQSTQTSLNLNAIFGTPDGKKLWIVGDQGTILHSKDGEHWTSQSSGVSLSLHSVFGSQDGTELWALSDLGIILHTTDGEHWTYQQTSKQTSSLRAMFGSQDGKQLWVVGDTGTILHSTDGKHWTAQPSGTKVNLVSLFGTTDGRQLWAAGFTGTILHSVDGEHWAAQSIDGQSYLSSISGTPDGKQLWAIGRSVTPGGKRHDTILHSTGGKHWTVQYSEITQGGLRSIFGADDGKQLWAVGARVVGRHDAGSPNDWVLRGKILHSIDGEHWVVQSYGPDAILYSLFGTPDGQQLWAAGERVAQDGKRSGAILHSKDGENWETQYSATDVALWSIFGLANGKQLWAVGGSGAWALDTTHRGHRAVILHSTDGEHWAAQSDYPRSNALYSIFGTPDGKQLWAVGESATLEQQQGIILEQQQGIILYSVDGKHWDTLRLPLPKTAGSPPGPPTLFSVFGTQDGKQLWVAGQEGTILHSTDGHWSVQHMKPIPIGPIGDLNSIFGTSDGKRLWVVGGEDASSNDSRLGPLERHCTILYSSDGDHWVFQSCGTSTPLFSIWGTPDARQLWAVGESGTVLRSTDGEHWEFLAALPRIDYPTRTYENYSFQSIFGTADGKRLWLSGSNPQQPPMPEPFQPPTSGILLQGEALAHAPYVESARLGNTTLGARLDVKLYVPTGFKDRVSVNFQARNDFDFGNDRPAAGPAQEIFPTRFSPGVRSVEFDPGKAAIGRGQRAHFDITLDDGRLKQHFYYAAEYDPFRFFRDNTKWIVPLVAVLFVLAVFTMFLFTRPLWNLYLYRRFKLDKIGEISIPKIGDALKLALRVLSVLPAFVKHPRTLDAWIEQNRERLEAAWNLDLPEAPSVQGQGPGLGYAYVQLPVRVGEEASGALIQQPTWQDFNRWFEASRWHLQIIGPGGAGKTTLARQIGRWTLDGSLRAGNDGHKMIPVWIDEDLSDANSISKVIREKLYASLPDEELESDFCDALLRKQRLLVIVDRLSERSVETQSYMRNIYRSTRLNALIVTSRTSSHVDGLIRTLIFPQPLNSASMLFFMTSLLRGFAANKSESNSGELGLLETMTQQLQLGQRLASFIELHTPAGNQEIPLLPLQVRLFVEQAIDFLSIGKSLDDLPTSLPEVYVQYLKHVNPKTGAMSNSLPDEEMLGAAKALGKLALQPNYVPKEFSREAAREALKSDGWTSLDKIDPLERLKSNGVLFQREIGAYTRFRFALDPIAEFLGAFAHAEECGSSEDLWNRILQASVGALGFQIALKLIRQAYGSQLGWALDQTAVEDGR